MMISDDITATATDLAARFAETAGHYDRTTEFPFANFDALAAAGLLSLTVARDRGGRGGGLFEARTVVGIIARGEPSTALVLAMHYGQHAAIARGDRWPAAVSSRLIRETIDGVSLINSAQVEPRVGSPSHGKPPETVARRHGDTWRISGHKQYCTGIPNLSWISVLAITDEPEPRLGSFLVSAKSPGITVVETWDSTGMRATGSHDVIFDDVEIPLDYVSELTPAHEGIRRDEQTTAWFMTLIAAVYDGVARSARDWTLDFVTHHTPASLGAPLSTLPRIRDEIGAIEVLLETNKRLLDSISRDADAGTPLGAAIMMVKHVVVENAVAVTAGSLNIAGNPGLRRSNPLERHHRDALCGLAHAPQNSLVRGIAATAALQRLAPKP